MIDLTHKELIRGGGSGRERGTMMTGGEAATVRPPQLRFRANADEAKPSRVLGGSSGY
jgi:hypothetical protein